MESGFRLRVAPLAPPKSYHMFRSLILVALAALTVSARASISDGEDIFLTPSRWNSFLNGERYPMINVILNQVSSAGSYTDQPYETVGNQNWPSMIGALKVSP